MMPPSWLEVFQSTQPPHLERLSRFSEQLVWHVDITLRPWDPPEGTRLTHRETYGWKPQVIPQDARLSKACGRSVGEVELSCRMRSAGWTFASWSDGFGSAPNVWSNWIRRRLEMPRVIREIDRNVRREIPELERRLKAGFPDVIAPPQAEAPVAGRALFVEYKGPKVANPRGADEINHWQDLWVRSALDRGLISLDDYVVVRWRPTDVDRLVLARQKAAWIKSGEGST